MGPHPSQSPSFSLEDLLDLFLIRVTSDDLLADNPCDWSAEEYGLTDSPAVSEKAAVVEIDCRRQVPRFRMKLPSNQIL